MRHDWVGDGDLLRIVQEIDIWSFYPMIHGQTGIRPENDMQNLLWDFEIPANYLILVRRLDLMIVKPKKRTCRKGDLGVRQTTELKLKKKMKEKQVLKLCQRTKKKKQWNCVIIIIGALGTISKCLTRELEELEIEERAETTQNYSILEIGQNTEKSPGDLRGQLTLVWKTRRE